MTNFKLILIVLLSLDALHLLSMVSAGHGHGLIGYGFTMYHPLCAWTCRDVLGSSMLNCSDPMDMEDPDAYIETSPECFATDDFFLQSMAYCLSTHCQDVSLWDLEKYWGQYLADFEPNQAIPKATYQQALQNITAPPTDTIVIGEELNKTMLVSDEDFEASANAQGNFEKIETNHATHGIVLLVGGSALPIAFSLLGFIPFPMASSSKFNAWLIDPPLFGSRHKTPIAGLFHLPTRGQSFLIFYLVIINIVMNFTGIGSKQPNEWYLSPWGSEGEIIRYIADRAGVLCLANIPLLILYAGRNNVLLWLTNWSHGTFLLLHRWVAWMLTIQASIHAILYTRMYIPGGYFATESKAPYWIWGTVAVLCMSILLFTSIHPIRQRVYEVFLAWHQIMAIFVLVGVYWHIMILYNREWGYINWIYTGIAVWGFERAMRLLRLARNGIKTARVTIIDDDYLRVDIENTSGGGHAYLYFPTLTWRVWENHPFSVASAVLPASDEDQHNTTLSDKDIEKLGSLASSSDSDSDERRYHSPTKVGLTFLLRTKLGVTAKLGKHTTLPVLVENAYGPHGDLSEYSRLICIAGGVGVTACVPYLRAHAGERKLFWGARSQGVVDAVASTLSGVDQHVFVGKRMNIGELLTKELSGSVKSTVVMICGPSEMGDEARCMVVELCRREKGIKVKLLEEAFSW